MHELLFSLKADTEVQDKFPTGMTEPVCPSACMFLNMLGMDSCKGAVDLAE